MTLNSKTLVITGVASGIGAELARLARFQGATVIGVDRNQPQFSLDDFHQADLGDPDSIAALVSRLPARLHGLCNWDDYSQWQWVTEHSELPRYPF